MKRNLLALLLAVAMLFSLSACSQEAAPEASPAVETPAQPAAEAPVEEPAEEPEPAAETGTWAVYWYLCGSDLESNHGAATTDLQEMMEVQLPENVTVVIETGGTTAWQNDFVDVTKLQRWTYTSEGLMLVDEQPSANMGEAQTLYEFLDFAKTNYPAEKTMVMFWDHGGGSVAGAENDELYGMDCLSLEEMRTAFTAVWEPSAQAQPLEVVGFDTCLMATVDVAGTFCDLGRYLVASEECEPGNGWYYTGWLGGLGADPSMDGAALGRIICDSYLEGCQAVGTDGEATLSLTDLSLFAPLQEAYETFGSEALAAACADPAFFSEFGREAFQTENYGPNSKDAGGFTNMVDLGHLARKTSGFMASSPAVLEALDSCVLYKVNGPYRAESTGLSCFYSLSFDLDNLSEYQAQGTGEAFKHFFTYELTGALDESAAQFVSDVDLSDLPEIRSLATVGWDGAPMDVDDEGVSFLNLGPEAYDILAGIGFQLFLVDEENDQMMLLGSDNDMEADWENGVFYDNFRGVWGAIDGNLVYMELSDSSEEYNLYSVPVLLNGEPYCLQVVYVFEGEEWAILGARQGLDDSGAASKEMRLLQPGDELTVIWKLATVSGDDDFEDYAAATVVVSETTAFGEAPLSDGSYRMVIEMWDAMGNTAYADPVQFDVAGGEIITSVFED